MILEQVSIHPSIDQPKLMMAVQCAQGPFYHRALNVSIILSVFDVTSDFLSTTHEA